MFSCEYCETFKDTYFEEHFWTTTSYFMKKNRHELKQTIFKSIAIYGFSIL